MGHFETITGTREAIRFSGCSPSQGERVLAYIFKNPRCLRPPCPRIDALQAVARLRRRLPLRQLRTFASAATHISFSLARGRAICHLEQQRSGARQRQPRHDAASPIGAKHECKRNRNPQAHTMETIEQRSEKALAGEPSEPDDGVERTVLARQQVCKPPHRQRAEDEFPAADPAQGVSRSR